MTTEQYVEVRANGDSYAIRILDMHEIIRMQEITHIPNTRSGVRGVINLRGQIIPVTSLRERLGVSDEDPTDHTRIVVVNDRDGVIGMIVDSVHQVLSFEDIQPPPEEGRIAYLQGIGRKGDTLVSILDLAKLIDN
ncbi:chemotaxis protein CheW [Alicyclobacillus ferrooxydans]|uniref:CheW-like domain-containing protein n=1 Tax=Alicyclobacillus ferrooxydans TaxID=471514 RepID=A0A0P9CET9_9BACL|nr:chemotaxis protein CheW [Alicyclobacillus ferrooxydans]KPV44344.1 hypothetical protein AN477_06815 [Alicyclobacillus ferrooxydans]